MKIQATARLSYHKGDSILGGYYRSLYLYVKFKEDGKLFKKKLELCLHSIQDAEMDDDNTLHDFHHRVIETIQDRSYVENMATIMILNYIK